mgnify:CR=1 FL=1
MRHIKILIVSLASLLAVTLYSCSDEEVITLDEKTDLIAESTSQTSRAFIRRGKLKQTVTSSYRMTVTVKNTENVTTTTVIFNEPFDGPQPLQTEIELTEYTVSKNGKS